MRTLSTAAAVATLTFVAACDETTNSTSATGTMGAGSGIPALSVTCPGDVFISVSEHGPVYINGVEAQLTTFSDSYWEAKGSDITASISRNPDGTASVSYTGSGGASGVCT